MGRACASLSGTLGEIDFRGLGCRRVGKREAHALRGRCSGGSFVGSGPSVALHDGSFGTGLRGELHFGSQAAGAEHGAVGEDGVVHDFSGIVGKPALDGLFVRCVAGVDPVEARLRVFVLAFGRAEVGLKEDVAIVRSPAEIELDGFVASDADGRGFSGGVSG
jgi:hypothetical protein